MTSIASRARHHARTLLVLTPLALATAAVAQSAPSSSSKLDDVTVTGTRSPMRLSEVIGDLTVLNRGDIERQSFGTIADLLRNRAGIEMVRNGGPGATTSLFLRGADTRHTVVLIDGVRVDSQSTGGASWQNIPLAQIERVEVLKGPASALYGSDAIGGVVQIFTRKGSGRPQLDLGIGGGSLGQVKADAGISGGNAQFDYAASLALDRGTGFNVSAAPKTPADFDKDGWRNYSGSVRLGGQLVDGQRLEFVGLKSRQNAGYDAGKAFDDRSITETSAGRVTLNSTWSNALSTQLAGGQSEENYETKPGSPYLTKTRIRSASLQGFYRINAQHQVNALLERREDRLANSSLTTPGAVDTRSENAIGLSYLMTAGAFSLQAHGRHDDDSEFGGINTGTLAAGYRLGGGWRVTASAGNAFRAPTLFQRGSINGPDLSKPGVEALRPERAHNKEAGLAWQDGDLDFAITAFHNRINDLIVYGAAGSCKSTSGCYGNVARALLKGTSLKGGAVLGPVRLIGNLELNDPTDASNGKRLARRAKRFGSLRAETELRDWTLGATVQGSSQRWDNAANTTRLPGYGLLNVDATYGIAKDWRVQLNVDNLFNRSYMTANNYLQARRTAFVMLRYTPSL